MSEYDGRQFVGIDLHRRRTVIVRQSETGEHLETRRIVNDPLALAAEIGKAGPAAGGGARGDLRLVLGRRRARRGRRPVHLAHPLGIKRFTYRRVKNDLLTELPGRSFERCARVAAVLARFRPRDQRQGRAAGVVRVGGAAARLA